MGVQRPDRIFRTAFAPALASLLLTACGNGGNIGSSSSSEHPDPPVEFHKISQTQGGFSGALADFDQFGSSVAAVGDIDGDGNVDLAVGAAWDETPHSLTAPGAVWILFMNSDLTVRSQVKIAPGQSGFDATIEDAGQFGYALAAVGDVDGDGVPDLAASAPHNWDLNGERRGSVFILLLGGDGTVKASQELVPGSLIDPLDWEGMALFGKWMAGIGDLDGDGITELAVGAHTARWSNDPSPSGVHIVFLDSTGDASRAVPVQDLYPSSYSLAATGDVDGDGIEDVVAAAGSPYLVLLRSDGTTKSVHDVRDPAPAEERGYHSLSESVAAVGDLDGDGVSEIAFQDTDWMTGPVRKIVIYYLDRDGAFRMVRLLGTGEQRIEASSIAGVGDLNGDGRLELAIGAPRDSDGGDERGAIWLMSISDPSRQITTSTIATTESPTTSTTQCWPERCGPVEGTDWDIEIHLEESRVVAAIDIDIRYEPGDGFFLGHDGDVECDVDSESGAIGAFSDCDDPMRWNCEGGRVLRSGIMSLQGFEGPQRLATCRYRSVDHEPTPDDFAISLRAPAIQPNWRGVHAPLSVVVQPAASD